MHVVSTLRGEVSFFPAVSRPQNKAKWDAYHLCSAWSCGRSQSRRRGRRGIAAPKMWLCGHPGPTASCRNRAPHWPTAPPAVRHAIARLTNELLCRSEVTTCITLSMSSHQQRAHAQQLADHVGLGRDPSVQRYGHLAHHVR